MVNPRRVGANKAEEFHELGKRGRKTGAVLPDTGERDEHGMQPLRNIFSSPTKAPDGVNPDATQGEAAMDLDSEPGANLSPRRVIPQAGTFKKTNLKSPARKNPMFDARSVGLDATGARGLSRKQLFADSSSIHTNGLSAVAHAYDTVDDVIQPGDQSAISSSENDDSVLNVDPPTDVDHHVVSSRMVKNPGLRDNLAHISQTASTNSEGSQLESELPSPEIQATRLSEPTTRRNLRPQKPLALPEEVSEADVRPLERDKRRRGQRTAAIPAAELLPKPTPPPQISLKRRKPGIPQTRQPDLETPEPRHVSERELESTPRQEIDDGDEVLSDQRPKKRPKIGVKVSRTKKSSLRSLGDEAEHAEEPEKAQSSTRKRSKPIGAKRKQADTEEAEVGDASLLAVQQGPPLPKGRGLLSYRSGADDLTTTRSGRHSVRPLAWWRGEHIVTDEAEAEDLTCRDKRSFILPSIKEVVRVTDHAKSPTKSRRPGKASKKSNSEPGEEAGHRRRRRGAEQEDLAEEPPEPWEEDPGTVNGEVFVWHPEYIIQPPGPNDEVEVTEERLAISAAEVRTRDIRDASFRFAKTLTTPFMGAGIMDMPPGAEKKHKNSRRMYMVFFVFYGKVLVTVNETQFRISAGGTWFVPRGNFYNVFNDCDRPARLFFAQACENLLTFDQEDGLETQMA